jgi:hypothetical protein
MSPSTGRTAACRTESERQEWAEKDADPTSSSVASAALPQVRFEPILTNAALFTNGRLFELGQTLGKN